MGKPIHLDAANAFLPATFETLEGRTLFAGTGLTAEYFNNDDFTSPTTTRVDSTINFRWKRGAPTPETEADTFSVRWTGQIEASFSEKYTFRTRSDDGTRVWINDQIVVDRWNRPGSRGGRGSIDLQAGQKYDIKVEYADIDGNAGARLYWQSASLAKQIVPTTSLYPTTDSGNSGGVGSGRPRAPGGANGGTGGSTGSSNDGFPYVEGEPTPLPPPIAGNTGGVGSGNTDPNAPGTGVSTFPNPEPEPMPLPAPTGGTGGTDGGSNNGGGTTTAAPRVVSFTLLAAGTDNVIPGYESFVNGAMLDLAALPTRNLNVRATVEGTAQSVVFDLDDVLADRVDVEAPWTLRGESALKGVTPTVGSHTLVATPYSTADQTDAARGQALTVHFTVVDSGDGYATQTLALPTNALIATPTAGVLAELERDEATT